MSRSPSPPPPKQYNNGHGPSRNDGGGPSKRAKLTQRDLQRIQVEKLLSNPDREVALPTATKEKTLRAPYEMMKNVQGSAAGAGSGEFHVYKASRRREFERLKIMEDKDKALDEQAAFKARQDARAEIADAKTAKNRAKRQKRKAGRKGGEATAGGAAASGGGGASGNSGLGGKRKLAGGADGFVPQRAGEQVDENDDEEDDSEGEQEGRVAGGGSVVGGASARETVTSNGASAVPHVQPVSARPVEEVKVVIHDDD